MTASNVLAARPRDGSSAPRAVVNLADFEPIARELMDPAAFDYVAGGAGDEWYARPDTSPPGATRRSGRGSSSTSSTVDPSTTLLGTHGRRCPSASPRWRATAWPTSTRSSATARAAAAAGVPFTSRRCRTARSRRSPRPRPTASAGSSSTSQRDPVGRPAARRASRGGRLSGRSSSPSTCRCSAIASATARSGFDLDVPLGNFADRPRPTRPTGRTERELGAPRQASTPREPDAGRTSPTIRSWTHAADRAQGDPDRRGRPARRRARGRRRSSSRTTAPASSTASGPASTRSRRSSPRSTAGSRSGSTAASVAGSTSSIALALGARGVLIGRPILWALAAAGQAGVEHALRILREEFEVTLALLGTPTPADVTRDHLV